ncbi:hypothetical protein BDM02DRAFT_3087627 [Thelephora ganbajun]|uniref:Uncharacterized protein n=1 Tax=Thelephora ganbajun TaxID=370292 RepID=A0ACB6ZV32_THEGA|nr:hypothetical protein BDM02DRAFT_3087627 [Thelephora ganbajun]
MASTLRKLKSLVLFQTTDSEQIRDLLETVSVPLHTGDCRSCSDPCAEGHEDWKFDRDMETQMLGTVKPYIRQIVISTGKADWEKEVTEVNGSLAALINGLFESSKSSLEKPADAAAGMLQHSVPGVFTQQEGTRLVILNGSHTTVSEHHDRETVLIFPDYRVVFGVEGTPKAAELFYEKVVSPSTTYIPTIPEEREDGELPFGILPIPYSCVILLCSHKRRDNRCHIAAPVLEHEFIHSLQRHNWTVDTNLDHDHFHDVLPPSKPSTAAASEVNLDQREAEEEDSEGGISPRTLLDLKRVLIIRNSHVGQHKFAGNVIICTPAGQSIWYSRVTAHEVDAIVEQTIVQGKIIPSLFRAGLNVSRPGYLSLYDW